MLQQQRAAWAACTCARARMGILPPIFTAHSVHRVDHFHVARLEAMLPGLHVAVKSSKIGRADANVLFAELGGATGPYLFLVHDVPLASQVKSRVTPKIQGAGRQSRGHQASSQSGLGVG